MRMSGIAAALSVAGAMSLASYAPAQSAPLTALSAAVQPTAEQTGAVAVRWGGWRGGGWGGGWGFGIGALAAGALIGAAIASPYYGGYYPYGGYSAYDDYGYGYGYGYGSPYYGASVENYPAYSYGYYRPIRHLAWHRTYSGRWHRPVWRHSYASYRGFRRW